MKELGAGIRCHYSGNCRIFDQLFYSQHCYPFSCLTQLSDRDLISKGGSKWRGWEEAKGNIPVGLLPSSHLLELCSSVSVSADRKLNESQGHDVAAKTWNTISRIGGGS